MFITVEELKQTVLNANIDVEYIQPAIGEAEDVYLREILGDALYNELASQINDNALIGNYATLVNSYIKPYLTYKVQSILVVPINFKMRNAGVISQYDQGFTTSNVKDTAYLADHYNSRAEFYANRLTTYLQKNAADFPEYGYSDENVTNPVTSQNTTTLYLGGTRKKCNGNGRSSGGSSSSVDWDNIQNKPDFAEVATSGDYNDLDNTPDIPAVSDATINIYQGNTLKGSFSLNQENGQNINLDAGGSGSTDWNDIQNKPDFAPVAESGSYTDLSNRPDMDEYVDMETYNQKMNDVNNALENRVTYGVYTPKIETIDNALTDKVDTTALCTINNERIDTRGNFELVRTDSIATLTIKQGGTTKGTFTPNSGTDVEIDLDAGGSGSTDWNDITNKPNFATVATSGDYEDLANKPTIPAPQVQADWQQNDSTQPDYIKNRPSMPSAQIQSDWNQTNTSEVDYIKNKPTIPVVPTNVSAFANDAGYLTQHQSLAGYATENWVQQQGYSTFSGSYNDLSDKPTIPAAQVQSDWNQSDTTAVDYIKNKPNVKPDLDLSTLTQAQYVDFYSNYATYRTNYDLNWGGLPILSINSWQPPVEMSPVPVMVVQYGIYGQSALMTGGDDEVFFGVQLVAADGSVVPYSDSMTFKQICHTASYNDLVDKPVLATVATSGSYNDLSNKPTIPAAQVQSDWNANSGMGEILNKPSMTAETWTFELSGGTTVTKTVWLQ